MITLSFFMDHPPAIGIIVLALFGLFVSVERVKALFFTYGINTHEFEKKMEAYLLAGKIEEAIAYCDSQGDAILPKVVKAILQRADRDDESIRSAYEIAAADAVPKITWGLGYLSMIANVATMVGLLGTIMGLIQSFQAVSFADPAQKQIVLAQGISVSMNATLLGLFVAVPVMIMYSFLQAQQNRLLEQIIGTSKKVVDMLFSRGYQAFDEGTAFPPAENAGGTPKNSRKKVG